MNLSLIAREFVKEVNNDNIISIGSFKEDLELISLIVNELNEKKMLVFFVPLNTKQSKHLLSLNQKILSLNDKEIDIALEFADRIDNFNNFVKIKTNSFIRDKMISQSALKLIVFTDSKNYSQETISKVCVEISTFAWQRTIIHLQSYGFAKILADNSEYVKTEIGHYLVNISLDKNISLEDFEYSVRNIPGVLETGVFLGLADIIYLYDKEKNDLIVKKRDLNI
jgi:ribose 5-phosphate isomerase A